MYYKRFNQKDLDIAMANESITVENMRSILQFYHSNIFILKGMSSVQTLQSVLPDSSVINYIEEDDLYHVRINSWPHIKPMCLKFARKNPCKWIYVTQDENQLLFKYDLSDHLIEIADSASDSV